MNHSGDFQFDDLQGLIRFGHGKLTDTCFLLLTINDAAAAKQWLHSAPINNALAVAPKPDNVLQIAFTVEGLRALGLEETIIQHFSDEFIVGMSGDESRSRRLGDIDTNAPERWDWGGNPEQLPHVLLLLYSTKDGIPAWRKKLEDQLFSSAFQLIQQLPTRHIGDIEPFGFADGVSQPTIDWEHQQSTDKHQRNTYSNHLAVGEVVLGYANEYQQYTPRPLISPQSDTLAAVLPNAEDQPDLKDFGRNGSYLVLRQLEQDVPGFWQFLDRETGSVSTQREQLAARMVGRHRDGSPLMPLSSDPIPGTSPNDTLNHFDYRADPAGTRCPFGAHIRRANPRTADLPPPVDGFFSWLKKNLGFGLKRPDEDLVASTRFHRLLRRGRTYGSLLTPEEAIKPNAIKDERGLQFICLVSNIARQFEFVQNAWMINSKFAGVQDERDPLLAHRLPLNNGDTTDQFNQADPAGPMHKTCDLPQFITVRGGAYFFMPGLSALKYLAGLPNKAR